MNGIEHILLGPRQHGVTRHGRALAGPCTRTLADVGPDAGDLADALHDGGRPVHLHLTDHLLGANPDAVMTGLDVLAGSPRDVHLTLHDIPQPAEGRARYERRREVYRRLVAAAASVQVCSEHERELLAESSGRQDIGVVPLPVDIAADAASIDPAEPVGGPVAVLGFVHPGKNPQMAIEAASTVGRDVVLLGEVVTGHEAFVQDLAKTAALRGVGFSVTGHLSETQMDTAARSAGVPFAPYRHVSASGSIGRWVAAGRRPIALRTAWVEEFARRAPWAVTVVNPENALDAVVQAVREPERTLTGGRRDGLLTTRDARLRQAQILEGVHRD